MFHISMNSSMFKMPEMLESKSGKGLSLLVLK